MPCEFDQIIDRRGTCCYKWDRYAEDVLPLPVADMDFISPDPVRRALYQRVDHGVFGYTEAPQGLYDVIRERLAVLYGWQVEQEEILFLPGVVVGLNLACHAVGGPGDAVLVQPPVYGPFLSAPGNAGHVLQYAELQRADERYEVDFDAFEVAMTDRTRTFILCNPHNPVGRVYERGELERMAEICLRHDVVICSDEIHCDILFSGHEHIPIASLDPEVARSTITLMAPSKTYNLAGLKCSFAVIQDEALRERYRSAYGGLVSDVNLFGYAAALAAYSEGQLWLERVLLYLERNRDFVQDYVREKLPEVEMIVPEGTYLAWLDCSAAGIAGKAGTFFLEQARVALNEGEAFGPGGEGFARLNFACARAVLEEALERMWGALERAKVAG
jgi:cystathionine beta-lyase